MTRPRREHSTPLGSRQGAAREACRPETAHYHRVRRSGPVAHRTAARLLPTDREVQGKHHRVHRVMRTRVAARAEPQARGGPSRRSVLCVQPVFVESRLEVAGGHAAGFDWISPTTVSKDSAGPPRLPARWPRRWPLQPVERGPRESTGKNEVCVTLTPTLTPYFVKNRGALTLEAMNEHQPRAARWPFVGAKRKSARRAGKAGATPRGGRFARPAALALSARRVAPPFPARTIWCVVDPSAM